MLLLLVGSPAFSSSTTIDIVGTTVTIHTGNKSYIYDISALIEQKLPEEYIVQYILRTHKKAVANK